MSEDIQYIATFGGLYYPKEILDEKEKIVKDFEKDYFLAAYLGTRDARYDQVNNQMVEMLSRDTFKDKFIFIK